MSLSVKFAYCRKCDKYHGNDNKIPNKKMSHHYNVTLQMILRTLILENFVKNAILVVLRLCH